ncbi:Chlorophyll a-b binding protein [Psidium guajava]|nr:Chlorophyll a-b binding protein [Psidium guajava]
MEAKGRLTPSMVKCLTVALAVLMLASVATSALPEIVASRVQVVINCSQPDCTNKCTEAYGAKLIRAFCQVLPVGKLCVCLHNP